VTLVAQSASKLYDGTPLTREDEVLISGLPEGYTVTASARGSQTDAGVSPNVIDSYVITDRNGEDVTALFINVETVDGRLVVNPIPLTVWTSSGAKTYDGRPLTRPDAGIGFGASEKEAPMNAGFALADESGFETLYVAAGTIDVFGCNPVTGETQTLSVNAGQKLSVRIHDENQEYSIEMIVEDMTAEEIPDQMLRLYEKNQATLNRALSTAQWKKLDVMKRIRALPPENAEGAKGSANARGASGTEESSGDLMILDCADVRIRIDSSITSYEGRSLDSEEAVFTPILVNPGITVKATGSQTEPGESPNTYEISWNGENPDNYLIIEELGTLRVLQVSANPTPPEQNDTVTPAPAHVHTPETVKGRAATCTQAGLTDGVRCTECGEWITAQSEIPMLAHTPAEDAAVAATCTDAGRTAGSHCSVCGAVLTAQTDVAALGHDWSPWDEVKLPDCVTPGLSTHFCRRCGVDEEADIPAALGHGDWYNDDNITGHLCGRCGEIREPHNWVEIPIGENTEYRCDVCGMQVKVKP